MRDITLNSITKSITWGVVHLIPRCSGDPADDGSAGGADGCADEDKVLSLREPFIGLRMACQRTHHCAATGPDEGTEERGMAPNPRPLGFLFTGRPGRLQRRS